MEHEPPGAVEWHAEAVAWFEHFVAGRDVDVDTGFVIQSRDGSYRTDDTWPHDDIRPMTVPLVPGSYRELVYTLGDGNDTDFWPPMGAIPPETATPAIHWTAVTQPLPYEMHLSGEPTVRVDVDVDLPRANVVATLLDVDTDGRAHYLTRGAYLADRDGTVDFSLFPQDWRLRVGHRLALYIAGSTSVHYNASNRWIGTSGGAVRILGGQLSIPTLKHERRACTDFARTVLGTDVIYRLSAAEAQAAAVTATLPGPYAGVRPCR